MPKDLYTAILDPSVPPIYTMVAATGIIVYWLIKSNKDSNKNSQLAKKSLDAIEGTLTKYGKAMALIQKDNQYMKTQIYENKLSSEKDVDEVEIRLGKDIDETKQRITRIETVVLNRKDG